MMSICYRRAHDHSLVRLGEGLGEPTVEGRTTSTAMVTCLGSFILEYRLGINKNQTLLC